MTKANHVLEVAQVGHMYIRGPVELKGGSSNRLRARIRDIGRTVDAIDREVSDRQFADATGYTVVREGSKEIRPRQLKPAPAKPKAEAVQIESFEKRRPILHYGNLYLGGIRAK